EGYIPPRLGPDEAKVLRNGVETVAREYQHAAEYEGQTGASPRELRSLLLDMAADASARGFVTPRDVLDAIDDFCRRGDYEFLRLAPDSGYNDHRAFVEVARQAWLDQVESELRHASELVGEERYAELFDKYISHASHWVKGEKLYSPLTSKYEPADEELMRHVEAMWG